MAAVSAVQLVTKAPNDARHVAVTGVGGRFKGSACDDAIVVNIGY